ncbi:MAG: hypothetical protein ACT4P6_19930 [Gemmatimonadaceae bacterium]
MLYPDKDKQTSNEWPGGVEDPRIDLHSGAGALFDARNPLKLLDRTDRPFRQATEPCERTGQYPEGTTFVEWLVRFRGRWYLYYGAADSRVGVAVWNRRRMP